MTTRLAPATENKEPFGSGATSIALESNGQIVLGGEMQVWTTSGTYGGLAVVRYNADGSLDSTFGTGGEIVNAKYGSLGSADDYVAIDGSGRIVVTGYSLETPPSVTRYLSNGTLDSTFGKKGVVTATSGANGIALQSTGKIVAYGLDGATLVRFNTNGSIDTTFGTNGFYTDSRINGDGAMVIQPTNDEVVITASYLSQFVVSRVLANGSTYDPAFGVNGLSASLPGTSAICSVALDPSGNILATGGFYISGQSGFATARFLGSSSTVVTTVPDVITSSPTLAGTPDPVLAAIVLNDSTFLDSLSTTRRRRLS